LDRSTQRSRPNEDTTDDRGREKELDDCTEETAAGGDIIADNSSVVNLVPAK